MRAIGIDYGDVRVGVSLSDETGLIAQGLEVIKRTSDEAVIERLKHLIAEYQVSHLVLGFPKNMNGTIGPRGEIALRFAEHLREKTGLPVELWDERLTTVAVERMLIEGDVSRKKRKQVVDKMAAALILQAFLDSRRHQLT